MKEYRYDAFLSFTGADRALKDEIKTALGGAGLSYYDSDVLCEGRFRDDFCEALDKSRVYIMILSDNLRNNPSTTGSGFFTEVRRESSLACELEARGELNIVILCTSEFFRFGQPFHDYNDIIGWHFYSITRGFSQIFATFNENGALSESTLSQVVRQSQDFVEKRKAGAPVVSQAPRIEISTKKIISAPSYKRRERETETVLNAFTQGKQIVVLSGIGGIGKTTLATAIAKECEEKGFFRCPQIVRIQEMATDGKGLYALVSSVSYEKSVYEGLTTLNESEKYQRKLQALSALPENILLVVDNYNSLSSSAIREAVENLKCKIIITTRAKIQSDERVEVINILALDERNAYEMFLEISKKEVSEQSFHKLYERVGGHTITLCIMAKMLSVHGMDTEELLGRLNQLNQLDERVEFEHNEKESTDTVMGHISSLFSISGFSDEAKRALRAMSVLAGGRINADELILITGQSNRNAVNELIASGWLYEEGGEVILHPVLSQFSAKTLRPTIESESAMIEYLVKKTDETRAELTYADAGLLEDKLYYACFVLSASDGRLCKLLWDRFVNINRITGELKETEKKVGELAKRLKTENEKQRVLSYGAMITLEQRPTEVEILDRYIGALESGAHDYKWVMRSLSVTITHLLSVEKYRPFLRNAILKAYEVAMSAEDDIALMELMNYLVTLGEMKQLKRLDGYIKRRKKKVGNDGDLLLLEITYLEILFVSSANGDGVLTNTKAMMQEVMNDEYGAVFKRVFRHPIIFSRIKKALSSVEKLPESDAARAWFMTAVGMGEQLANEGKVDIRGFIRVAIEMYNRKIEHGLTLSSATNAIAGCLAIARQFPVIEVKRAADEIVEELDFNKVSVRTLVGLQVSVLVNKIMGDRKALEQSSQVLSAVRRLRPAGHNDIIDALIAYADTCSSFGEQEKAFLAYNEVRCTLQKTAPDSALIGEVANKMLALKYARKYNTKSLKMLMGLAVEGKEKDWEYYGAVRNYSTRIADKLADRSLAPDSEELSEVIKGLYECAKEANDAYSENTVLSAITECSKLFANAGRYELAERMAGHFDPLIASKRRVISNRARVYKLDIVAYSHFRQRTEDAFSLLDGVVSECIRLKTGTETAATNLWLMAHLCVEDKKYRDFFLLFARFVKKQKNYDNLIAWYYYIKRNCFDMQGVELTDEIAGHAIGKLLIDYLKNNGSDLFGVTAKRFYRMKSAEKFYYEALCGGMESIYEAYRESKITIIKKEEKKG